MKKRILLMLPILLLSACGDDAQQCDDRIAEFPDENYSVGNFTIKESYNYELDNPYYNHELDGAAAQKEAFEASDKKLVPEFSLLDSETRRGETNIINYAFATSLTKTAELSSTVRYQKLFDGQVSCAGPYANSRLGLYSDGIIIDLNKRLETAEGITVYMTHNYLSLKMKATVTLYKNTNTFNGKEFETHNFSFYTNLGTSAAGAKFFYLDLKKILPDTSVLKDTQMIGFSYQRIQPSQAEMDTGYFAKYYETLEEEKALTESEGKTFVKLYDIALPYSTWR